MPRPSKAADGGEAEGRSAQQALPPLAEAKLAAPRPRSGIPRPRLLAALEAGAGAELTLLAAPPGYGKTTVVRTWCASHRSGLAWVTLDAGDNDPVRLWAYVATAVDRVRSGLGRQALEFLGTPAVAIERAIDELANGISAFGDELVVVLDDLHNVTDSECLATIDYFVRHLPPTTRLIVATRADPTLDLANLRARGGLLELRASELAFTADEAGELFGDAAGIDLDPAEIETLLQRTEGWPAALFLAALWLRAVPDAHAAVRTFGGDHRFVADYLSREVIASLDEDLRWFVLRASVLGQFTTELCDAVFDRSDSAEIVTEVERTNMLIARLEHGSWFRVHALFEEFAGHQLESLEPGAAVEIHRRAAAWLRARGLVVEAVEHAAAAGDHQFVTELLVEFHRVLIRNGRARTILLLVRTLPDDQLVGHPEIAVAAATASMILGRSTLERRRLLHLIDRSREADPESITPYVEAAEAMVRALSIDGDVGRAVVEGRHAVEMAGTAADEVLVAALGGCARALYFAGEYDEAWAVALRAVEHPDVERRPPGHALARSTLALVAAERGQISTARAQAERAKAILASVGSSRSWLGASAAAAMGVVLAGEGDLAEAERELAHAEHLFRDEIATVHHTWALVLLARIRCLRGRLEGAEEALRSARAALGELADSSRVASLAESVGRELDEARARFDGGELLDPPSEAELAVLRLLATNLSAREIAAQLYLSPNTVRSHSRSLYRKLGVNSRSEAVARAGSLDLLARTQSPR